MSSAKPAEAPTQTAMAEAKAETPPPKDEELERIEKFYAKPENQPPPLSTPQAPPELPKATPTDAITDSKERTRRGVAEMGRGGEQHRTIQNRIKEVAEAHGLRATIEGSILDGGSHVDVVLERGGVSWACQIATGNNSVDHEFGQVRNCFKAGFENVVVIATKLPLLKKLESAVVVSMGAQLARHVSYFLPGTFLEQIPKLATVPPPEPSTTQSHGYKVSVETVVLSAEETKTREQSTLEAYTNSIQKRRRKK